MLTYYENEYNTRGREVRYRMQVGRRRRDDYDGWNDSYKNSIHLHPKRNKNYGNNISSL